MSKIAWAPVLELLGKEIRFEEFDSKPYEFAQPFPWWKQLLSLEKAGKIKHSSMRWLEPNQVLRVHDEMIAEFGGEPGLLDKGKVDTAIERAKHSVVMGKDVFPTILHKAASIMHQILLYHPFLDGQKRTGISSAFIFLGLNGYLMWSRDVRDEVHFAIRVAKGDFEVEDVTRWLAARVVPLDIVRRAAFPVEFLDVAIHKKRQCSNCGRFLSLSSYQVTCSNCGAQYNVVLNAAVVQPTASGSRFVADFGIRARERK
jgi:death-on-curing protein